MKMNIRFAKQAIMNKDGLNHMELVITPPEIKTTGERKPVCIVFAKDRSGSMRDPAIAVQHPNQPQAQPINYGAGYSGYVAPSSSGQHPKGGFFIHQSQQRYGGRGEVSTKMDYAQNAVIKFLTLLTPKDKVGIVSFDDIAFPEQQPVHITEETMNAVVAKVRSITPRGCTNISDALKVAKKMFTPELLEKYTCKIILVSDGIANRGISQIDGLASVALECAKTGITISSLGIGVDYNAGVMGEIARSGNGLFYHIKDLSTLEDIFKEELNLSSIVSAKNVKAVIEMPGLIEIGENMNNYPQVVNGGNIEISLGDMYNTRKILFEIRNNFVDTDVIFNVNLQYKNLEGNDVDVKYSTALKVVKTQEEMALAEENKDVIDAVLSLIKNKTIEQSSISYEQGDIADVQALFCQSSSALRGLSMTYSAQNVCTDSIEQELNEVSTAYTTQTASSGYVKDIYAKSSRDRRS